jgi:signal recognition particle receptor subunit beta
MSICYNQTMTYTNHQTKDLHLKVIYLGPKGSGKTRTLRSIFERTARDKAEEQKNSQFLPHTQYFDFLPMSLGMVQGYHLKVHLFTLPSALIYPRACEIALQGVDGFIFVAHSSFSQALANQQSFLESQNLFLQQGYQINEMPSAFQYNWQDCEDALPKETLRKLFPIVPYEEHTTVATSGTGTLECLQGLIQKMLLKVNAFQGVEMASPGGFEPPSPP